MPGTCRPSAQHQINAYTDSEYYYCSEHETALFMYQANAVQLHYYSSLTVAINTPPVYPDLMTMQAYYFSTLADFGRDDLFVELQDLDLDELGAIQILAELPDITESPVLPVAIDNRSR